MGNIQAGDKPSKAGKSPAKGKNFMKKLNRKSSGHDIKKTKKVDGKQHQNYEKPLDKTPDSDNETLAVSDSNEMENIFKTIERELKDADSSTACREPGPGGGGGEGQVTVPTCLELGPGAHARSTNREQTAEERAEQHNNTPLPHPADNASSIDTSDTKRIASPAKDSSSDSVFTDPLTPLAFAAEINQCYYSAESDSTLEEAGRNLTPCNENVSERSGETTVEQPLSSMPQSGLRDGSEQPNNDDKKEIENIEVSDRRDSCYGTKDEMVMGSLLSSPKHNNDADLDRSLHECSHEFTENRLKASAAQTSFTLSRHRRVELPPTKLNEACLLDTDTTEKEHRRYSSVSDAASIESNVLRKVASLTLEQATVETKVTKPKFVPEKLDFQIYEKFEGQMLVNWFISSVSEDSYMKNLLSVHDLRTLGTQYCTHLLAAGVLRQIADRDAPTDAIFRPDLMYYWAHTETPTVQAVTPGKIQMLKWPPNYESNVQRSKGSADSLSKSITHEQILNEAQESCKTYCSVKSDEDNLNLDEAKTMIAQLKRQCESLQLQLEKYKTLNQIQSLTQNAQEDFSSPTKKEEKYFAQDTLTSKRPTNAGNKEPLNVIIPSKSVINIPEVISDNLDVKSVQTVEVSSIKCKNVSSITNENLTEPATQLTRLNGTESAGIRSDEVENFCKLNKIREQISCKVNKNTDVKDDAIISEDVNRRNTDDAKKLNGMQITPVGSELIDVPNISVCSKGNIESKKSPSGKKSTSNTEMLITSTPLKGFSQSSNKINTNQQICTATTQSDENISFGPKVDEMVTSPSEGSFIYSTELSSLSAQSVLSKPEVITELVASVIGPPTPPPPPIADLVPLPPPMPESAPPSISGMIPPPSQMPGIGPSPPPMPSMSPPPPPTPGMGPPPPLIPGIGPPPPLIPGIGPPPPPMPSMGPPPPPMPSMSPPPPPMPSMGPPPPPMPGIGPPPPPMPSMGPPPPPMPGMGPPPPPMPGTGPPPPPMPGTGPPPPPMPGMGPPPPPMAGIMPPPPLPDGNSPNPVPPTGIGPPPPPMSGPVPFPAPPAGGWNQQRATLRKTPVMPTVPMKPLYWTRILAPPQNIPVQPEAVAVKPLWVEIEETSLDNIDEFTDLFSRQVVTKKPAKKKVETKTKIQPMKVLDCKRSQNVGILAQSLHVEFTEIENAIYNFDTSVVSLEALHQIYELRATDEELSLIKEHLKQKTDIPLDKPEAFLHDLAGIHNFAERISCFMFQAEFEDSICTIMHKLDNLKHTCEFLLSNEDLKRLFAIILTLGNYMNGGNGQRGQADGFGLEILAKLRDVKSKESTVTLLHFIVRTYVRRSGGALSPECVLPVPEPGDVARAAALDFQDVQAALQHLGTQLQGCRDKMKKVVETDEALQAQADESLDDSMKKRSAVFKEKMSSFLDVADEKLKSETDNLEECRNKFLATVKFYQYTPKTGKLHDCEPKEFFALWSSFCTDFKDIFKKEEQLAIKEKLKETKKQKDERKGQVQPKKEGGLKARLQKLAAKK